MPFADPVTPAGEREENLRLMRLIDEQYLYTPWYGTRQTARHLRREGHGVGRKRIRRLMRLMGLTAICQKAILSGRIHSTGCILTCCEACRSTGRGRITRLEHFKLENYHIRMKRTILGRRWR